MQTKLKPREKRIMMLLLLTAILVFGNMLLSPFIQNYQRAKTKRQQLRKKLDVFLDIQGADAARQEAIEQMVPVFELPVQADKQGILFRDETTKQLQQCGLDFKSIQLPQKKSKGADGYQVWTVECQGQCELNSIMRFVEEVKKNPYYVAIEKLTLKVDSKDRKKMTYHLAVSTYAKIEN